MLSTDVCNLLNMRINQFIRCFWFISVINLGKLVVKLIDRVLKSWFRLMTCARIQLIESMRVLFLLKVIFSKSRYGIGVVSVSLGHLLVALKFDCLTQCHWRSRVHPVKVNVNQREVLVDLARAFKVIFLMICWLIHVAYCLWVFTYF